LQLKPHRVENIINSREVRFYRIACERAMKARPRNPRLLREVRNIVKTGGSANGMANSGDIRFPESFIYKIGSRLSGARLWAGAGMTEFLDM
jgi:hypothetical protein